MDREEKIERMKPLLREVLTLLGEDPEREGLQRTPERWADALLTYTSGLDQDARKHLEVMFKLDDGEHPFRYDDMIVENNIHFASTCEHHMAPFRGLVHIAYIPDPDSHEVIGLSKLTRVVNTYARRLQMQERMTQQIAQALEDGLRPLGVIVLTQAVHYCMIQRGVEQHSTSTLTVARRGVFLTDPVLENKFQEYLRLHMPESNF